MKHGLFNKKNRLTSA